MRVVLHIGLHKSGTSTLQKAWSSAFGRGRRTWYPRLPHGPSHALVAWWVREKQGVAGQRSLVDVLAEADRRRTELLLLSSEEFHEATGEQCAGVRESLAGREVSVLVTLTQPCFRWPSLWQEMVKHGWASPQAASIPFVDEPGVLGPGRLEELVERWGFADTRVCLVRQHPAEPRLVERVSDLMGVPLPSRYRRDEVSLNISIGDVATRALCEVNRLAPDTRGVQSPRGRAVVAALQAAPSGSSRVLLDADVAEHVAEAAALEKAALERLSSTGRVRLDDAWGLLGEWGLLGAWDRAE